MVRGIILLWYGAIVDIPSGFILCDGTLGTPDLRDRFIVGAGGAVDPDNTGGASEHVHPFTGDGHVHSLPPAPVVQAGTGFSDVTDMVQVTGITDAGSSMPPYYALAFIMKT